MRNLIVPVEDGHNIHPFFERLLSIHAPDSFIAYLDRANLKLLTRSLEKIFPDRQINLHEGIYYEKYDRGAHPVSLLPDKGRGSVGLTPYEFPPIEFLISHEFSGPDADSPYLLAMFGQIHEGQQADYEKYLHVRVETTSLNDENLWRRQFDCGIHTSVLNLTTFGIRPQRSSSINEVAFTIVVASSVFQLCVFWNMRAIRDAVDYLKRGRRTLLLAERLLESEAALASLLDFIRNAPPLPERTSNFDFSVIYEHDHDREKVESALGRVGGTAKLDAETVSVKRWSGNVSEQPREADRSRTLKYVCGYTDLPEFYEEGFGRPMLPRKMVIGTGTTEVILEPPEGFRNRFRQAVVVDLVSDLWARYPKSPQLAKSIWQHSWFTRYGVSAQVGVSEAASFLNVSLPDEWVALCKYFDARGYTIRVSDKGQYAKGVLALLGGPSGIKQFASRQVYNVLEMLALKSSKKVAQRIIKQLGLTNTDPDQLAETLRDVEVVPELKRVPKTLVKLKDQLSPNSDGLLQTLAQLSKLQVVKRGLHLQCPRCGTPDWYTLGQIAETLQCVGCSTRFPLPAEYPTGSGKEPAWEYTLNTLVNRAMDQDVFPVLLALNHVLADKPPSCLVPGLELLENGKSDVQVDFDFLFVRDQQLFAGECKAGTELAAKDIATAQLADNLGFHEFWFCTISRFSDAAKALVSEFEKRLHDKNSTMSVKLAEEAQLLDENERAPRRKK